VRAIQILASWMRLDRIKRAACAGTQAEVQISHSTWNQCRAAANLPNCPARSTLNEAAIRRGSSMWFFNGTGWQFVSLASPAWTCFTIAATSKAAPKQTIHEMPVAVDEYMARIREHCD